MTVPVPEDDDRSNVSELLSNLSDLNEDSATAVHDHLRERVESESLPGGWKWVSEEDADEFGHPIVEADSEDWQVGIFSNVETGEVATVFILSGYHSLQLYVSGEGWKEPVKTVEGVLDGLTE